MVVFMKKLITASFIAVSLSVSMQAILAVENDSSLQTLSIVSVEKRYKFNSGSCKGSFG